MEGGEAALFVGDHLRVEAAVDFRRLMRQSVNANHSLKTSARCMQSI